MNEVKVYQNKSYDCELSSHYQSTDLWYAVIYHWYTQIYSRKLWLGPKILPLIRLELCSPHLVDWMLPMRNRGSCISHPKKSVENRCILRSPPAEKSPQPFFRLQHPLADLHCPSPGRKKSVLVLQTEGRAVDWSPCQVDQSHDVTCRSYEQNGLWSIFVAPCKGIFLQFSTSSHVSAFMPLSSKQCAPCRPPHSCSLQILPGRFAKCALLRNDARNWLRKATLALCSPSHSLF